MSGMSSYRCTACGNFLFLESQHCPRCGVRLGFHWPTRSFWLLPEQGSPLQIDGRSWTPCAQWDWECNWLVAEDEEAARCFSCRLTRRRPDSDDTLALEKLAEAGIAKRRLLVQLFELGLSTTWSTTAEGSTSSGSLRCHFSRTPNVGLAAILMQF